MSETFINCPECNTLLMAETGQCPACRHVLDESKLEQVDALPDDNVFSTGAIVECRNCSEFNGVGLVRCWSCGTFLRPEIEELYNRMLADREQIEYQPLPEINDEGEIVPASEDAHVAPAQHSATIESDTHFGEVVNEKDFELDPEYAEFVEGDPEDEIGLGDRKESEVSDEKVSEDEETYSLSAKADEDAKPEEQAAESDETPTADSSEEKAEADKQSEATDSEAKPKDTKAESDVAHSEATGGDVLFEIALEEEKEAVKQRRFAREQRKKRGRRPGQKGGKPGQQPNRPITAKQPAKRPQPTPRKFPMWVNDIHLHEADVKKIKPKPGSLAAQFRVVDIGLSAEQMMLAGLLKSGGLFSRGGGDKEQIRQDFRKFLETTPAKPQEPAATEQPSDEEKPKDDAEATADSKDAKDDPKKQPAKGKDKGKQEDAGFPVGFQQSISREDVQKLKIVYPAPYVHESAFAGAPIFGEGRIGVLLPGEEGKSKYLSFVLTEFRRFSGGLKKLYGVKDLGLVEGVPLSDKTEKVQCHYSEDEFEVLAGDTIPFYETDPKLNLELVGRRCEHCGLVVSEDARRKEKIGGLNGKGISKAKCPKCEKKFGSISLYRIAAPPRPTETTSKKDSDSKEFAAVNS